MKVKSGRDFTITLITLFLIFQNCFSAVIRTGMTLNIVVKDDKELSQMVVVQDDGTIEYPLLQDTPILGKTTSELQDLLTYKLAKVVDAPLVLVTVITETPIRIQVMGQVKRPGLVTAPKGASLQEILLLAEGATDQADLKRVKLVKKSASEGDATFYDLHQFMQAGDLGLLPKLESGDRVIFLTSKKSRFVKVLGAVTKPGFYPVGESASVFDLLYLAGGPAPEANLNRVRIVGSAGGEKSDYLLDVQRFIDQGKTEDLPLLAEGDMMIVYAKTVTWSKALTVVRDIVALVTAWLVITQVLK
jgi:protein involved in polysaccharide export with SLBB domain